MASLSYIIILMMVCVVYGSVKVTKIVPCPEGEIRCDDEDGGGPCILLSQLCDGKNNCSGGEDEHSSFCRRYKGQNYYSQSNFCDEGQILCTRYGIKQCFTPSEFCNQSPPCDYALSWGVCLVLGAGQLIALDVQNLGAPKRTNVDDSVNTGKELSAANPLTLSHEECPQLYTKVGEECLSFLHTVNVTWGEARAFCQTMGGDLISFRDLDHFTQVRTHMGIAMQTRDYWIGGRYVGKRWTWLTDEPMSLGFPMWALRYEPECQNRTVVSLLSNQTKEVKDGVCYHYTEAPRPVKLYRTFGYEAESFPKQAMCVAISFQHYYRYTDEDCLLRKSPLCVALPSS